MRRGVDLVHDLPGHHAGAGLYELRIEVPQWLEQTATGDRWNADADRDADTGRRFWAFVTTGPLTLLTLASLVLSWRTRGAVRRWWFTAAIVSAGRPRGHLRLLQSDHAHPDDRHDAPGVRRRRHGTAMGHAGLGAAALTLVAFLAALRALMSLNNHRSADQHEVGDRQPTEPRPAARHG